MCTNRTSAARIDPDRAQQQTGGICMKQARHLMASQQRIGNAYRRAQRAEQGAQPSGNPSAAAGYGAPRTAGPRDHRARSRWCRPGTWRACPLVAPKSASADPGAKSLSSDNSSEYGCLITFAASQMRFRAIGAAPLQPEDPCQWQGSSLCVARAPSANVLAVSDPESALKNEDKCPWYSNQSLKTGVVYFRLTKFIETYPRCCIAVRDEYTPLAGLLLPGRLAANT
jgi:hypothetical protein